MKVTIRDAVGGLVATGTLTFGDIHPDAVERLLDVPIRISVLNPGLPLTMVITR